MFVDPFIQAFVMAANKNEMPLLRKCLRDFVIKHFSAWRNQNPVAFGANVILLRRMGAEVDRAPTVLLAGLMALFVALPMGWPLTASWRDVGVLAVMGVFQLGLGCLLLTLAVPHLSAAEVGLLSLLETVLGPVWVWLGIGERPSDPALFGGVIVITSLLANEIAGIHQVSLVSSSLGGRHRVKDSRSGG